MEKQEIYHALNKSYFSEQCDEMEVLNKLRPIFNRSHIFVDIGASLGQYTKFANENMQDGRIYCLEADPVRFEELERNCQEWGKDSRNSLSPIHAAASDTEKPLTFYSTMSNVSGGLFKRDNVSQDNWTQFNVQGLTLDSLMENTIPDFIKIDVEGSELRVLRGAEKILKAGKTKFLIEIHSWPDPEGQKNPNEVYAYMRGFGYVETSLYGKLLFQKPNNLDVRYIMRRIFVNIPKKILRFFS
jgi:FkbM family methyltransferase